MTTLMGMSLPNPVLDLAAEVVPEAEDRGRLAFAYAHGPLLAGFGDDAEVRLVCVWDHETVPEDAPTAASHITIAEFDRRVHVVTTGQGWDPADAEPLTTVAQFAYGVLLSDDEGAGTRVRGVVSDFPQALCEISAKTLMQDRDSVPDRFTATDDPWQRAVILIQALYNGYVAWYAANGHYYAGAQRRTEYADHFGLEQEVPRLERVIWDNLAGQDASAAYVAFAERILSDC